MSQFKDAQPSMTLLVFSAAFMAWMVSHSFDAEAIGSQPTAVSAAQASTMWPPFEPPSLAPSAIVLSGSSMFRIEHNTTKIFFPPSRAALPLAVDGAWPHIVQAAEQGQRIQIAGFHDTTGNARQNTELAKERAHNVRQQLIEMGVPSHAITVKKPAVAADTHNHAEARRVEVTVLR